MTRTPCGCSCPYARGWIPSKDIVRFLNVAAVLVTATLPPFARVGGQIDVTVSAIGDSDSLLGGTLVMTPLNAADGQIYAVAQGTLSGPFAVPLPVWLDPFRRPRHGQTSSCR